MGRHAASGSDGPVEDNGPGAIGPRLTDPANSLWRGPGPGTSENRPEPRFDRGEAPRRLPVRPVLTPAARAVRVPPGATSRPRMAETSGPAPRSRPAMPPVPPPAPHPASPRTTVAPFAAVPTPAPDREAPSPSATALDDRRPAASVLRNIPSPAAAPPVSQPLPELPPRPVPGWSDGEHPAPWSTGRGEIRAERSPAAPPGGAPFVERRASRLPAAARPPADKADLPAYGDWTKPSGPGRMPSAPVPPLPAVPPAPLTSAIPDRALSGRRAHDVDDRLADHGYDDRVEDDRLDDDGFDDRLAAGLRDHLDDDRAPTTTGPVTGTVVGGRAALRAERESREAARVAAEAARRRRAGLDDLDEQPRRPRRLLTGLVAVAAVAAGVLGVYTVATPDTTETSATSPSAPSTEPTTAPTSAAEVTAALPPLDTDPLVGETAPATPVRVPVTVLNSTTIQGLAGDITTAIEAEGWQAAEPASYPRDDVAATTVFFTKGNDKQRQAALQLVDQFPKLQGPTPRFFEVPSSVQAPGLVIVATGDWTP